MHDVGVRDELRELETRALVPQVEPIRGRRIEKLRVLRVGEAEMLAPQPTAQGIDRRRRRRSLFPHHEVALGVAHLAAERGARVLDVFERRAVQVGRTDRGPAVVDQRRLRVQVVVDQARARVRVIAHRVAPRGEHAELLLRVRTERDLDPADRVLLQAGIQRHVGCDVDQQDQLQIALHLQRLDQRVDDHVVVEVLVLDVDEALREENAAQIGLEHALLAIGGRAEHRVEREHHLRGRDDLVGGDGADRLRCAGLRLDVVRCRDRPMRIEQLLDVRDRGTAHADADVVDRSLRRIGTAPAVVDVVLERVEVVLIERRAEEQAFLAAVDHGLGMGDHRGAQDAFADAHEVRVVARVGVPLMELGRLEAARQQQVADRDRRAHRPRDDPDQHQSQRHEDRAEHDHHQRADDDQTLRVDGPARDLDAYRHRALARVEHQAFDARVGQRVHRAWCDGIERLGGIGIEFEDDLRLLVGDRGAELFNVDVELHHVEHRRALHYVRDATPGIVVVGEPAHRVAVGLARRRARAQRRPAAGGLRLGQADRIEGDRVLLRQVGLHDLGQHVQAEHDAQPQLSRLLARFIAEEGIDRVVQGELAGTVGLGPVEFRAVAEARRIEQHDDEILQAAARLVDDGPGGIGRHRRTPRSTAVAFIGIAPISRALW